MSILLEALHRANARKDSLWEGRVGKLGHDGICLLLSGADLDPADLAGYLDAAASAFLLELAAGEDMDAVVQGVLAEGLLMGMMIDKVQQEHVARGYRKPVEPGIVETATTLWRLVFDRIKDIR